VNVRPFHPDDLPRIDLQPSQIAGREALLEMADVYAERGPAYTVEHGGRIVCCAGVIAVGSYGVLWSALAAGAPMLALHRAAIRFLSVHRFKLLQATAALQFEAGCRWLEMLGFERRDAMPDLGPDGAVHVLYERFG